MGRLHRRLAGLRAEHLQAASSGKTGATPPTHTSGTVSDGGVSWTFVKSFFSVAKTGFNMVGVNSINRVATAAYYDGDGWVENVKVPA